MYESRAQTAFQERWNIRAGDTVSLSYWEHDDQEPEYVHESGQYLEFFDGVYQGFQDNSNIMFFVSGRSFLVHEIESIGRAKPKKRK